MDISETADGICIHTQDGTVLLSNEQAYSCLEWLWERRDMLRGKDDEPEWDDAMWHRALRETRKPAKSYEEIETEIGEIEEQINEQD